MSTHSVKKASRVNGKSSRMFYLQFAKIDPGMMKEINTNLYVEMPDFQSLV